MRPERWLLVAGLGTWIAAAVPTVLGWWGGGVSAAAMASWSAAALAFLAAFGLSIVVPAARTRRWRLAALLVQTLTALAMVRLGSDVMAAGVLLVMVASQLLGVMTASLAAVWIVAQTAALITLFGVFIDPLPAVTYGGAFGGFQFFALGTASLAQRERQAREALSVANAELHATRALMVENGRVAERLRISRDLHDAIGHHLTALNLQLDVATRLTDGKAAEHLAQAHQLARTLLTDVRDVVSQVRDGSRFDLARAVRALSQQPAGDLRVHVDAPDVIPVDDEAQAQALLRCLQEIVTNTMRHAHARDLWLTIESTREGITVRGRDDGRGAAAVHWGLGLTGMRERFEALRGTVDVTTHPGGGFDVRGFVPRTRGVS